MVDGLVSIIMPSWNTAKFIAKSIQCVIDQTYQNWELLIVDDCSTDNTDEIAKEAGAIVRDWPNPDENHYVVDSKKRKTLYEESLGSGSIVTLAPLLEGAMQRKKRDGHLNSMDGQFVSHAEPLIYGSIAHALNMDYANVREYIINNLGK